MPQYSSDIDAAEAELQQELREMFTVDTQQHLETYFTLIQQLNARSWAADIQHLYRAIHTVKGGAVTVAADAMLHAAIVLEDLLSDLRYLEQAPPLADRQLVEILLEAGELLSSSIEITETGDSAIAQVQPTVGRLQQLRALVKQLYLPDWNELKQVHQEFAEQGFDLVTLDLEMALADIPDRGVVPAKIIDTAQATIDQLSQIGRDLELASGWTQLIQSCEQLVSQPNGQLWQQVWPEYFQVLKTCVKNSGEISDTEIARLETLAGAAIDSAAEIVVNPIPAKIEPDRDLPDLLDDFFLDEEPIAPEAVEAGNVEFSSVADLDGVTKNGSTPLSINSSNDISGILDNFFFDEDEDEVRNLAVDEQSYAELSSVGDLDGVNKNGSTPILTNPSNDISNALDNFFFGEDEEVLDLAVSVENHVEPAPDIDRDIVDNTSSTSFAPVLLPQVDDSKDISDILDNFFFDENEEVEGEISRENHETEDLNIDKLPDDSVFDEDEKITIWDSQAKLDSLVDIAVAQNSIGHDEIPITPSTDSDDELDNPFHDFSGVGFDNFTELSELDESELIALIESGFTQSEEALPDDTETASINPAAPKIIAQPELPTAPVAERPVETIKRGIQIPVPLERLDKSAQQVVDTLLTARAVMNVSTQLQSQLSQLTNLTQESSQFVARLRQLQDDYALIRNLSDDQDSGNNVTLERYRQGYSTINRLLENILRMTELGQEIETANYQSSTRLDALDRSILRLKDGIETSRLVPFRNMTLRARAILRDLTNRYGKPAELIVENEQIELDAGIVQQLEPVLLHLLRNAYDHGLETMEQRLSSDKPAQGMIYLSLNRRGNLYRLTIEDDGGGIDANLIHQIARSKGFSLDRTNTPAELLAVLCQPGFSSSNSISEVSGRGVGMDVVTAQLASISGKLSLETTIGHGTKFTIEIPAPQLLVPCVLLQVGERTIALPTDEVLETALMSSIVAAPLDDNSGLCTWTLTTSRGQSPGFDLANYWQPSQRSLPDTAICIRTRQADDTTEIWSIADDLLGQAELLITPLPSPLIAPVGLLGVSLQPDGRLISILDPIALTAKIATAPNDSSDFNLGTLAVEQAKSSAPTILIVDDAALMRRRFEASLNTHGFITHTCNDGVEALNWLQSNRLPDLMITDVEMPNMDGFTLIDRCRQAKIEIPILVVSSRLSEEWGKEARRLGANDYLNKGFSTTELLQKVDSLLGVRV